MELNEIKQKVESGDIYILDAVIKLRSLRDKFEKSLQDIKDFEHKYLELITFESEKQQDVYKGFSIKYTSGRQVFKFDHIQEWCYIKDQMKKCEDKYKSMLKAKINGAKYANIDSEGQELKLPEINYTKSYITIKKTNK